MKLRVISLGAGVQSTAMALMAAHGEITPMPDCAIFADTGWEPQRIYEYLRRLEATLPFPVYRVSAGNLRESYLAQASGKRGAAIPLYTANGMKPRQCTSDYKIRPIIKQVRSLVGLTGKRAPTTPIVEQWIGISFDEIVRMKESREPWIRHRWPLIELQMKRRHCLEWMADKGYPQPARSACIGCPFHDDHYWRDMREHDPVSWADAVAFDKGARHAAKARGFREDAYVHRSLKPLDEVDLSTAEDRGQLNLFLNECEGMCGL